MWLHVFGRLKPGVAFAEAEGQANAILQADLASFYGNVSGTAARDYREERLQLRRATSGASPARSEFSESLTALLVGVGVLLLIATGTWFVLVCWARSSRPWAFHIRSLLVLATVVAVVMLVARLEDAWLRYRMPSFLAYDWFPDSWWKNALPSPILSHGPWWASMPLGAAIGCAVYAAGLLAVGFIRRSLTAMRWQHAPPRLEGP